MASAAACWQIPQRFGIDIVEKHSSLLYVYWPVVVVFSRRFKRTNYILNRNTIGNAEGPFLDLYSGTFVGIVYPPVDLPDDTMSPGFTAIANSPFQSPGKTCGQSPGDSQRSVFGIRLT